MNFYWQESPKIDRFVLPGGTVTAANLHLCRCFAREAERNAVALLEYNEAINEEALKFLNRLSDYFFALARWVNGQAKQPKSYMRIALLFLIGRSESEKGVY